MGRIVENIRRSKTAAESLANIAVHYERSGEALSPAVGAEIAEATRSMVCQVVRLMEHSAAAQCGVERESVVGLVSGLQDAVSRIETMATPPDAPFIVFDEQPAEDARDFISFE